MGSDSPKDKQCVRARVASCYTDTHTHTQVFGVLQGFPEFWQSLVPNQAEKMKRPRPMQGDSAVGVS